MKRTSLAVSACLITLALAAPDAMAAGKLRPFGLGVSLPAPLAIEVPVNIGDHLRVAPAISLSTSSTTTKPSAGDEVSSGSMNLGFGVGVFYLMRSDAPYLVYVGPRLGLLMRSTSNDGTKTDTSAIDFLMGVAVGGEHFLTPRFSLGAEVNLSFAVIAQGTTTVDGKEQDNDPEVSNSGMSTGGSVNARFYF